MSQVVNMKVGDLNFAASGDNTLIALSAGAIIRVYQLLLIGNAAVNVIFKHGATAFNGFAFPLVAAGSAIVLDHTGQPWFTTLPGEAFIVNLSGAVQATGQVYYTIGA